MPARLASDWTPADERVDFALVRLATVLAIGAIIALLDTTVVNIAIDALAVEFAVPLSTIQWISTGYLISVAVAIPIAGWAIGRYGGRRVWLWSVGWFVVGSVLAGLAWNAESLIAFRVFQGLAGGMIEPVVLALMAMTAGPQRVGRLMALMLIPINLGPILGPVLGGLILDNADWRWIFVINLPIGAIALLLGNRYIPRDAAESLSTNRLDIVGLALLSPGFAALVHAITVSGEGDGFGNPLVWGSALLGVILVAGYVRHALRMNGQPLLDVRLFVNTRFALASVVLLLVGIVAFATNFLIPLYAQQVHGASSSQAGMLLMPLGVGVTIGLVLTSTIGARWPVRWQLLTGGTGLAASSLALTLVEPGFDFGTLGGITLLRGVALALIVPPTITSMYGIVRQDLVPQATSVLFMVFQLGAAVGIAAGAIVIQLRLRDLGTHDSVAGTIAADPRLAGGVAEAFSMIFWGQAIAGIVTIGVLHLLTRARRGIDEPCDGAIPVQPAPAA